MAFCASMRDKYRELMNTGDVIEDKRGGFRRHLKTDKAKRKMVKHCLELINNGHSWEQAAAERGKGYSTSGVIAIAKKFDLYKPSQTNKSKAESRSKIDAKMPLIQERRKQGFTVTKALVGTGVTKDQYFRALDRLKMKGIGLANIKKERTMKP